MNAATGHNHGPAMDTGQSWRRHCWKKARTDLIPHLPIEILRGRVSRAKEIGLDYKTYASVRASTGRDVVGFLFSSNALRSFINARQMPEDRRAKLGKVRKCDRIALVTHPLDPAAFETANPRGLIETVLAAPLPFAKWSTCRQSILDAARSRRLPADGILLVGDTALEREWSEAGRLAGYLPAERYFQNTCA